MSRFKNVALLGALVACCCAMASGGGPIGAASPDERTITVERVIAAPVEKVWRAWTTAEGWKECMGVPLNVELRPGGPFEVWFAPTAPEGQRGSEGCRVLSYLPERMLSFSWNTPPNFPTLRAKGPVNIVVIEFEPQGDEQTRVRLTHHGWPTDAGELQEEWDGAFGYLSAAWPKVLEWIDMGLTK